MIQGPARDRRRRRRARTAGGHRDRAAAGQPALVGPQRRRLPGRARRLPRRRPLRLGPGGAGRGGRRAARPAARQGADVLEIGARRRAVLALAGRAGRPPVRARPLAPPAAARPADRRAAPGAGRRCALVQADAGALPFADALLRPGLLGVRRGALRRGLARVMREVARVLRPGGRWVFSVHAPDPLGPPRRAGPGGADRRRPRTSTAPPTSSRTTGAGGLRRAPPHAGRPGPGDRRGRAAAGRPGRAGVAGLERPGVGRLVARCAAGCCRAPRSSSACRD